MTAAAAEEVVEMDGFDLGKAAEWARKVAQKFEKKGRLLLMAGIFGPSGHVCTLACFPRGLVEVYEIVVVPDLRL